MLPLTRAEELNNFVDNVHCYLALGSLRISARMIPPVPPRLVLAGKSPFLRSKLDDHWLELAKC